MRVIVTGGGTKIPLDPVRKITNSSEGTFAADICTELLRAGHEVVYIRHEKSITPFTLRFDCRGHISRENHYNYGADYNSVGNRMAMLYERVKWAQEVQHLYLEMVYDSYNQYVTALNSAMSYNRTSPISAVVLAAAVSDYTTDPSPSKIRTANDLTIHLRPTPKVISTIKEQLPETILVGFKLLSGRPKAELLQAAWDSIDKNRCDIVVANDLKQMRGGKHPIYICTAKPREYTAHNIDQAKILVGCIQARAEAGPDTDIL